MYDFVIPDEPNISCKLFMYSDNIFSIPVVIYFFCDDDLEKHINICNNLMLENVCHVIMVTNMDLLDYKKKIIRLIDFVYLEMNIDIMNIVILGIRWATSFVTYALYYCNEMYDVNPYSLIFIYPVKYNADKVKSKLSYCTNSIVLFIDDEKHEYSEELLNYINNISSLDFPTYANYTHNNTDMIMQCRYVIRPIRINPNAKYVLPTYINFTKSELPDKKSKYKINVDKIRNKYAEIKKMLS